MHKRKPISHWQISMGFRKQASSVPAKGKNGRMRKRSTWLPSLQSIHCMHSVARTLMFTLSVHLGQRTQHAPCGLFSMCTSFRPSCGYRRKKDGGVGMAWFGERRGMRKAAKQREIGVTKN